MKLYLLFLKGNVGYQVHACDHRIMKFEDILVCLFTMIEKVTSNYLYSMTGCCEDVFTVVPAPRSNFASVRSIQISPRADNHSSSLCEVFVFGGEYEYKAIK